MERFLIQTHPKLLKDFQVITRQKNFKMKIRHQNIIYLKSDLETPFIKCSGGNNCPEIFQGKFTHFVSRKAMDIDGLGQEILFTLINQKFIKDFSDIYSLADHRSELEQVRKVWREIS